jgi:nucleoside-diphosphate-sugar epimerase
MTRSAGKSEALRLDGAQPVVADALDASAVNDAVVGARPDVVVHQLTAIPARLNVRRIDRDFALTNRLRTEGTDHLIAAARAAGARRFVVQSFTGWPYAREGGPVKDEDDPLDPSPPARPPGSDTRGHPSPRGRRRRRRGPRGRRPALRSALRPRDLVLR